ncbi:beta-lactamase [Hyphomonas neptunium ATCC 15444]|uniref:Beta-lactamase n=2 Tax=Hyphomonas TaxID=85 RepID=Q0C1S7_HYPNA|nr:beta-lactamase [Hyphomonas neptunium ATCC 15444]
MSHCPPVQRVAVMTGSKIRSLVAGLALAMLWTAPSLPGAAQSEPVAALPATEGAQTSSPNLTRTDVDTWLDGLMPYALEDGGFTGAVVAVVKDGELLTSRGYGYADPDTGRRMDGAATLIRPGSISKLFTWTAVMQLKEQGQVNLDTDINQYLDFTIPDAFDEPITLRHLMTHTSGFEESVKDLIVRAPSPVPALGDYVKTHLPERVSAPGEVPAYSNYGTALAGYIVERASGERFDDYVERHIFAPLEMQSSSFRQPLPAELADNMSGAFKTRDDNASQPYELIPAAPAGALASTAEDMARFMIAHLNAGAGLLSPETANEMQAAATPFLPPLNTMALGFYQQDRLGVRAIGHGGDTVYFHSDMSLFPDHNVGLFISVNSQGRRPAQSLLLREQFASRFVERYLVGAAPKAAQPYQPEADNPGREIAGVYEVSRASATNFMALGRYLGQARITVDAQGRLHTPFLGIPAIWQPIAPDVWQRAGSTQRLAVSYRDGKVHQWAYEPASPFMVYSPPPWYRSSALLNPLLALALLVSLATVVAWPLAAFLRWRYQQPFPLTGHAALSHRLARIGLIFVLLFLMAWMGLFVTLASDIGKLTAASDGLIRFMQGAQIVLYGAMMATVWNLVTTWSGRASWPARLWSVLLPLAVGIVIWFAAVTGLLSFSLTY